MVRVSVQVPEAGAAPAQPRGWTGTRVPGRPPHHPTDPGGLAQARPRATSAHLRPAHLHGYDTGDLSIGGERGSVALFDGKPC